MPTKIETINVNCKDEEILLSNLRCAFWEKEKMLLLSDMHLGKTAHFRKNGIAIPSTILNDDLLNFTAAIKYFDAQQILIVGDMFHHQHHNLDIEKFAAWRKDFGNTRFLLVQGNHDRLTEKIYSDLHIEMLGTCYKKNNLTFSHSNCEEEGFVISGHTHPGITIFGKANQKIKLPCFAKTAASLILPAFSKFTGLDAHTLSSKTETDFFAFTEQTIFKV